MSNYRKLIAAAVGLSVIFLQRRFQIDLLGMEDYLTEIVLSVVTAVAVWGVPNALAEPKA